MSVVDYGNTQGSGLLMLVMLGSILGPAWLLFDLGGRDGRYEEATLVGLAAIAKEKAIDVAISEERQVTAQLRSEVAALKQQVEAVSPSVVERLRRDVEQRRDQVKPGAAFLLDDSLSFTDMLKRMTRLALGEALSEASVATLKGPRGFNVHLRFPAGPGESESLAELAKGLSTLPDNVERRWVSGVVLEQPEAKPLGVPFVKLTTEAWRVLLATFRQPHRQIASPSSKLNSRLHKIGAISVTNSLEVKTTFEVWGRPRFSATLPPGTSSYKPVAIGAFVLRAETEGRQPWVGVLQVRDEHVTEVRLDSRR